MVVVLRSSDMGLLAFAKSLLQSEEIHFEIFGEGLQDLIGGGRLGGGNIAAGPAEIAVADKDAERARQLLAELLKSSDDT